MKPAHWGPAGLLIFALAGCLLTGSLGIGMAAVAIISSVGGQPDEVTAAAWLSGTFLSLSLAGLAAAAVAGRQVIWPEPSDPGRDRPSRRWYLATGLFPIGIALGWAAYGRNWAPALLGPLAQLLAIGAPVLFAGLLLRRSAKLAPLRAWGLFLTGAWLAPVAAFVLEVGLVVVGAATAALSWTMTPQGRRLLERFELQGGLPNQVEPELLAEFLFQPVSLAVLGMAFVVVIPMLEEVLKPMAVWAILSQRPSPAEAFVAAGLAGAGFAFAEGLFLAQPQAGWPAVAAARLGATFMHALTSGFVGWGLAEAFVRRRWIRLPLALLLAVGFHGLWNLAALGVVLAGLGPLLSAPGMTDQTVVAITALAGIGLGALTLSGLVLLPAIPRALQRSPWGDKPEPDRPVPPD